MDVDFNVTLTNFGEVWSFKKHLIKNPPNEAMDELENKVPENFQGFAYNDARIRSAQFIQTPMENTQERSLIVQYEDRIVRLGVDGTKGVDIAL